MRKVFLLAFALFAWNILANAQESDERYIEVTGSSEIEVVPDEIHFLIQIKEYWEEEYTGKSKKEEDFRTCPQRPCHRKGRRHLVLKGAGYGIFQRVSLGQDMEKNKVADLIMTAISKGIIPIRKC